MDQAKGSLSSEGTNYIVELDFSPVYIKKYIILDLEDLFFISNNKPVGFNFLCLVFDDFHEDRKALSRVLHTDYADLNGFSLVSFLKIGLKSSPTTWIKPKALSIVPKERIIL